MHRLESSRKLVPPRIGVAAHQENAAKPPLKAQTGWSFETDHPVRAFQRLPSAISFDGTATPPILGGDYVLSLTTTTHQTIRVLMRCRFDGPRWLQQSPAALLYTGRSPLCIRC